MRLSGVDYFSTPGYQQFADAQRRTAFQKGRGDE
jgi:hypothetical protein